MVFLENLFKGVGLATLTLINYNIARGLLGEKLFEIFYIIKKLHLSLPLP